LKREAIQKHDRAARKRENGMIMNFFKKAGAAGHVFLLKGGRRINKGLAFSGFIGPWTTVAVVPTAPQIINFAVTAQTRDKQGLTVQGAIIATLIPMTAVERFDFTVDHKTGGYLSNWTQVFHAKVIEQVVRAVLDKMKDIKVEEAMLAQKAVEDAVTMALGADAFSGDGIKVDSCSVPKIVPVDDDVREAIGMEERQFMLTAADTARHDRHLKAVENERAVKKYEADTRLELERKQGDLLDEQAKNERKKAEIDAKATEIRLAPLQQVESGKLLGAAIMDAAKGGRLGNLAITSEFLAAIGQK
jgi:hypothetical protein